MEIRECKSYNFIFEEIEIKLEEIRKKIQKNYKNNLWVYNYNFGSGNYLAEKVPGETKLFGFVINRYKNIKDILVVSLNGGNLQVEILDSSEFLYPLIKEEFTKFAEENKDNIKSLHFIKDF